MTLNSDYTEWPNTASEMQAEVQNIHLLARKIPDKLLTSLKTV